MMLPGVPLSGGAATVAPAADVDTDTSPAAVSASATAEVSAAAGSAAADLGSSGFSEDERGLKFDESHETNRNSGGNRWPRQETLALLKIRSDMDVAFRDSSLKAPLWDEISRKLAALGYHRSAKKCKEKFENVYKYHKRTKEGRTSKADGKTYRFFDQLEALEGSPAAGTHHHHPPLPLPPPQQPVTSQAVAMPNAQVLLTPVVSQVSQPNNVDPISVAAPAVAMTMAIPMSMPPGMNVNHVGGFPFSQLNISASTDTSSSSTSSDEEPVEKRTSRKRKWREFFGRLMKEVVNKQEELQLKFLDSLERRERDRMAREEAWRMQELAKIKREHELLAQERSIVAAKDAAVVSFLQKLTEQNPNVVIPQMSAMQLLQQQQQQHQQQKNPTVPPPPSAPSPAPATVPSPPMQQSLQQATPHSTVSVPVPVSLPTPSPSTALVKNPDNYGVGETMLQPSPSRWPKAEIYALINLRTTLDTKYQENGPKGPLWEEISSAMRKLGYNRNAKRCKEKWENINKYYKKVKESSKKRPEDSKTCPYFHQLDAIYREKAIGSSSSSNINNSLSGFPVKPETQMAPIMARPEQQWPLPTMIQHQQNQQQPHQQQHQHHHQQQLPNQQPNQQVKLNEDMSTRDPPNEEDYDDDDDDDDDEEEEGGEYEIVPNKTSSMAAVE